MRKKIWRMSEGRFDDVVPILAFEPGQINIDITEGESFESSFRLISTNNEPARGLVYSTHPYIYTLTPAFSGTTADISYKITSDKFKCGDIIEGEFIVIYNGMQTSIPIKIRVCDRYLNSSLGQIRTMDDFCELARRQWREALRIFYTNEFAQFISTMPLNIRLLYRGYQYASYSPMNLEEFLASAKLKSKMTFDLDERDREYSFIKENIKETLEISRSTWGYTQINVSVDADFVTVEKEVLTSDFFLGTLLTMNYYIHKDLLHEGRNYATITFEGMGITRKILIKASLSDFKESNKKEHIAYKRSILNLWKSYEAYRLRELTRSQWSGDTIDSLSNLLDEGVKGNTLFMRLVLTHAMIVGERKQDALWEMKKLRKDITNKRSVEWAYLLYLGALMEPEESYVKRLTGEVESIFRDNPEDVRLFWFLLFLRDDYRKDPPSKLKAVRQWIMAGYDSPVLFVEAYDLFAQDPYLISSFDEFTLKILNWADKKGAIKTAVADRLFDILGTENEFRPRVFKLIETAYSTTSRPEYLVDIISYLLKYNIYSPKVLSWYEKGITENLKLTGLYEGYVLCLPSDYIDMLPIPVARYFIYGSNISFEKKALVYANIISFKKDNSQIYDLYLHEIRSFSMEQMRLLHIDDNLAIIYQDLIDSGYIDAQAAELLSYVINTYKIITPLSNVKNIIIYENALKEPYVSPVHDHFSYVRIITGDYKVFLELNDGRLITDETKYIVEPMLSYGLIKDKLRRLSNKKLLYFIQDFSSAESAVELRAEDLECAEEFLFSPMISYEYLCGRFHMFTSYFKDYEKEDVILKALMYENRYKVLDTATINYLAQLLILEDRYEEAEEIIRDYLCLDVNPNLLLRLMNRLVKRPREENGEFVLEICIWLLRRMYYSQDTLTYLNDHYIGSSEDMMLIFNYADHHRIEIASLAERIIVQLLYTELIDESADEVFMTYCEFKSNAMIIEAYLTYWSHRYLMETKTAPPSVFAILFQQERVAYGMNETCRMALMKHLALLNELSPKESTMLDSLIREYLLKNVYFSFYRSMKQEFIIKYHLYDKMFAEYVGEPKKDIVIRYKRDNGSVNTSEMIEMYNGIYVRQFVIFFGETIHYEIYDKDNEDIILLSDDIIYQDIIERGKESRYGLLNRLESSYLYHNDDEMIMSMEKFEKLSLIGDTLFNIL